MGRAGRKERDSESLGGRKTDDDLFEIDVTTWESTLYRF